MQRDNHDVQSRAPTVFKAFYPGNYDHGVIQTDPKRRTVVRTISQIKQKMLRIIVKENRVFSKIKRTS